MALHAMAAELRQLSLLWKKKRQNMISQRTCFVLSYYTNLTQKNHLYNAGASNQVWVLEVQDVVRLFCDPTSSEAHNKCRTNGILCDIEHPLRQTPCTSSKKNQNKSDFHLVWLQCHPHLEFPWALSDLSTFLSLWRDMDEIDFHPSCHPLVETVQKASMELVKKPSVAPLWRVGEGQS